MSTPQKHRDRQTSNRRRNPARRATHAVPWKAIALTSLALNALLVLSLLFRGGGNVAQVVLGDRATATVETHLALPAPPTQ
jgi:hypothetical protein